MHRWVALLFVQLGLPDVEVEAAAIGVGPRLQSFNLGRIERHVSVSHTHAGYKFPGGPGVLPSRIIVKRVGRQTTGFLPVLARAQTIACDAGRQRMRLSSW